MMFELINPSDPYFFEAPDLEIAAGISILLGEGMTPAKEVEGSLEVPFFMFGANKNWFQEKFNMSLEQFLSHLREKRKSDLIAAFESVLIGSLEDRELFFSAVASIDDPIKRESYKKEYINKKRSSANDFGGRAVAFAKLLKEGVKP